MLKRRFTEFGEWRVHHGKASMGHDGREYTFHDPRRCKVGSPGTSASTESYHQASNERTATREPNVYQVILWQVTVVDVGGRANKNLNYKMLRGPKILKGEYRRDRFEMAEFVLQYVNWYL